MFSQAFNQSRLGEICTFIAGSASAANAYRVWQVHCVSFFVLSLAISHIEGVSFASNLNCFMPFTWASLGSRLRLLPLLLLPPLVVALPATAKYAKQIKFHSIRFDFVFSLHFAVYNEELLVG